MSKLIATGKKVTLYFAIKLEDGQIVDSNFGSQPAVFTVGDGNLPTGFEQALFGLEQGMQRTLKIPAEKGFGLVNPDNYRTISRTEFRDINLEKGVVISFSDATRGELPGVITDFSDTWVEVNFNHPLAGKALDFEVDIIRVEDAIP